MRKLFAIFCIAILSASPASADNSARAAAAGAVLVMLAIAVEEACEEGDYKNYSVGQKMLAQPGNALIDIKKNACKKEELILTSELEKSKGYRAILLKTGDTTSRPEEGRTTNIDIAKDNFGDKVSVTVSRDGVVVNAPSGLSHLGGKQIFTPRDRILVREKTFSQEIIYTGVSGNEVHFLYREFIGDMIRSPFTVPLVFDLEKSNKINVKGYKLEILSASNHDIEYMVNN